MSKFTAISSMAARSKPAPARCWMSAIPPPATSSREFRIRPPMTSIARCKARGPHSKAAPGAAWTFAPGRGWSIAWPTFRGQFGGAVPAGNPQQRPSAQRDPRAAVAAAGLFSVFRRTRALTPRRGDSGRGLLSELYTAHADRHRRQLHTVQSPLDDHVQVARGGAGERMRHCRKTLGIYAADDPETGADFYRGGTAARRVQRRARPWPERRQDARRACRYQQAGADWRHRGGPHRRRGGGESIRASDHGARREDAGDGVR